jgi:hypothetical protein
MNSRYADNKKPALWAGSLLWAQLRPCDEAIITRSRHVWRRASIHDGDVLHLTYATKKLLEIKAKENVISLEFRYLVKRLIAACLGQILAPSGAMWDPTFTRAAPAPGRSKS